MVEFLIFISKSLQHSIIFIYNFYLRTPMGVAHILSENIVNPSWLTEYLFGRGNRVRRRYGDNKND